MAWEDRLGMAQGTITAVIIVLLTGEESKSQTGEEPTQPLCSSLLEGQSLPTNAEIHTLKTMKHLLGTRIISPNRGEAGQGGLPGGGGTTPGCTVISGDLRSSGK